MGCPGTISFGQQSRDMKNEFVGGTHMTKEDRGHYAEKHAPDKKIDPAVADVVKKRAVDGKIPCAVAFDIAKNLNVSPGEVGFTVDMLEIRLIKCQLGLFGYAPQKSIVTPAESVPQALEEAIQSRLKNGELPCAAAWEIATTTGISKMAVSSACETLGVKIRPCQLGAF